MSMQGGTIDLADLVAKLGGGLAIGGKGKARSEKKKVKVKDVRIRPARSHVCGSSVLAFNVLCFPWLTVTPAGCTVALLKVACSCVVERYQLTCSPL